MFADKTRLRSSQIDISVVQSMSKITDLLIFDLYAHRSPKKTSPPIFRLPGSTCDLQGIVDPQRPRGRRGRCGDWPKRQVLKIGVSWIFTGAAKGFQYMIFDGAPSQIERVLYVQLLDSGCLKLQDTNHFQGSLICALTQLEVLAQVLFCW